MTGAANPTINARKEKRKRKGCERKRKEVCPQLKNCTNLFIAEAHGMGQKFLDYFFF